MLKVKILLKDKKKLTHHQLTADRTEVLLESSMQTKPAAEGIKIPYETQSTKSRGQSTSHQPSAFKPTPTLLTKNIIMYATEKFG